MNKMDKTYFETNNGLVGSVPSAKQSEIVTVSQKLHKIAEDLTVTINHLENRLEPVMRKELEKDAGENVSVPEFNTPLAQDMNNVFRKVAYQIDRLNTIHRKLEI